LYFNIFVRVLIVCLSFCLRMDVDDEDEVDGDGGFEAELALLDEVEADMRSVGEGPEAVSTSTRWSRPPVALFDPATDALVFQQFDVDFHTGDTTSCIYSMTCLLLHSTEVCVHMLAFSPVLFLSHDRMDKSGGCD